jgi:hypothetical protein
MMITLPACLAPPAAPANHGIVRADIGGVHGPCRKARPARARTNQGRTPADQGSGSLARTPMDPATGGK